jgi:hypothetical protein
MYGAAIRLVPVHWVLGFFNVVTWLYDAVLYVGERIFNFFNTMIWNLVGYDQVYVFQDNCPTPIPYRAFMLGGTGRYKWYYNTRSREFEAWVEGAKRQFIPALSINIRQDYNDEDGPNNRYEYDLTKWLDTVKFKTVDEFFPHPMQLVAAWSLHSGIWPSFVSRPDKQTRITMVSGMDGETYDINVATEISRFRWRDFAAGRAGTVSSPEESDSEDESDESDVEESASSPVSSDAESQAASSPDSSDAESEDEQESESDSSDAESVSSPDGSDVEEQEQKTKVEETTEASKALFLANSVVDEISAWSNPSWSSEWTIMPSSFASFASTIQLYTEVGLPPIEGYVPTVNPDMEAVD